PPPAATADTSTPLNFEEPGYLYDRADHDELESDLILDAGHYDAGDQTWSFSAEVPGIIGLTEPLSSADNPPAERVGKEGDQT
ncbi:hypothetical protein, partial [Verrucosispora sp. ts21]|uniref:hypothetical protein n=1 Tax=Verrucosispora sp. ts21 TaxID=2069341 RepID=UPI001304D3F7